MHPDEFKKKHCLILISFFILIINWFLVTLLITCYKTTGHKTRYFNLIIIIRAGFCSNFDHCRQHLKSIKQFFKTCFIFNLKNIGLGILSAQRLGYQRQTDRQLLCNSTKVMQSSTNRSYLEKGLKNKTNSFIKTGSLHRQGSYILHCFHQYNRISCRRSVQ